MSRTDDYFTSLYFLAYFSNGICDNLHKANQETDENLQQTIDDIKFEAAKTGIDSKDMALSYRPGFYRIAYLEVQAGTNWSMNLKSWEGKRHVSN